MKWSEFEKSEEYAFLKRLTRRAKADSASTDGFTTDLEKAIAALGDDVDDSDYWNATEGNAKRALYGLLAFAKMRPDGVWDGD